MTKKNPEKGKRICDDNITQLLQMTHSHHNKELPNSAHEHIGLYIPSASYHFHHTIYKCLTKNLAINIVHHYIFLFFIDYSSVHSHSQFCN